MKMPTFSRSFYVPKDRAVRVRQYDDIPAQIVTFERAGKPIAIGWRGKAQKPTFHYRFASAERREHYIAEWLAGQREHEARKAERRKAATNGAPRGGLKVGNVLYSSWGYDQTNVDWYEVTKLIGKTMVEVREIGAKTVGEGGGPSEHVVPHVGNFIGEPTRHRPRAEGWVRISDCQLARKWDGEPKHQTGFGWGH